MYYPDVNFNLFFEKVYIFAGDVLHYTPSWSFLALIIFVFLMKEIKSLVSRLKKFSKDGAEFEAPVQQKVLPDIVAKGYGQSSSGPKMIQIDNSLKDTDNKAIETHRENVRKIIDSHELFGGFSDKEKIEFLIKEYCTVYFNSYCEIFYSGIFKSQVRYLEMLSSHNGLTREESTSYFEKIKKENTIYFENWDFESFLRYLFNFKMIYIEEDLYRISDLGKEFLKWLKITNKSVDLLIG